MNAFRNDLATELGKAIASMDLELKTQDAVIFQNVSATNDIIELIQGCVMLLA